MFRDFSFRSSTTQLDYVTNCPMEEGGLDPASRSYRSLIDEGYCSSETNITIAELSRDFDRQSLQSSRLETSTHRAYNYTSTAHLRRSSPSQHHLTSVRQQRQFAARRQCSSENLARISHLVERILQVDDSDNLASHSAVRNAHQKHYPPPECVPSIAETTSLPNHNAFSPYISPLSLISSAEESESDNNIMTRAREFSFGIVRPTSAMDGERVARRSGVEKTVRMRKRPTGRILR